jgi:hypothetical protein
MRMDMNEVESFMSGVTERREMFLNDNLWLGHQQAILTNKAMWDTTNFPTKAHRVDLTGKVTQSTQEKSRDEMIQDILRFQAEMISEADKIGVR